MIIESANQVKHFLVVMISNKQVAVVMHISGKIMISLGLIMCIIGGVMMFWGASDGISGMEDAQIYNGSGGEMELSSYSESGYLVVVMEGEYADGTDFVRESESVNLTEEDCVLVRNFTMINSEGVNYFEPACEISDDTTGGDGHIHIGYICKDGCSDGTYTWETNNTAIQIWDADMIIGGILQILSAGAGGSISCCCGGFIAFIGLILGFTLKTPEQKMALAQGHQTPGVMPQQEGTMHSVGNHPGNI